MKKIFILIGIALIAIIGLVGCDTQAAVASRNLSYKADQFQIYREVVFYNGITDKYVLEVRGFCSVTPDPTLNQLAVTCKQPDGTFVKHFFGLSNNMAWFVFQLQGSIANTGRYMVRFKPSELIPIVSTN